MSEYCFKIKFTEPIFKNNAGEVINVFHAHLISDGDSDELRLFFDPNELYFEHNFSEWLKKINWSNIGQHFEVLDINDSEVFNIDFSQSTVIGLNFGTNQYIGSEKYITIKIDWIRLVRQPNDKKVGTAEFYLNHNGFGLVSDYYSVLSQSANYSFSYSRMEKVSDGYQLGDFRYNPQFNFYSRDSRNENTSTIHKEPLFKLEFEGEKTEMDILNAYKLISLASSFFQKRTIDFITSKIYLNEHVIIIHKKAQGIPTKEDHLSIWPIYKVNNIDKFYKKIVAIPDENHLKMLELIVIKFIQSNLVDVRSSILLLFSILEICKSSLKKNEKPIQFTFVKDGISLSKDRMSSLMEQARNLILDYVEDSEKLDFINKWKSSIDKIVVKPMKSPFLEYLESIGFKPVDFAVEFSKIKDIRDSLTHGSTKKYGDYELMRCNQMLRRLSIGLILHQFKIKDWIDELDMSLPN